VFLRDRRSDAVDHEFERIGVRDVIAGALPGNVGAIRLYERRGYRPTWLFDGWTADTWKSGTPFEPRQVPRRRDRLGVAATSTT
jgi:RimJ/RimL family protein N-acetyltransferase